MTEEQILEKADNRLNELYGDKPYGMIIFRFLDEIEAFADRGVIEYFYELSEIVKESTEKYNEKLVVKAPIHSSLLAYLLGASEINPLPPHYYCDKCKRVEWIDEDNCVFDMRGTKVCECGTTMRADGHNMPWQMYLPYYAQKIKSKDPMPESYKDFSEALTKKHFQWSLLGAAQAVHLLGQATGIPADRIDMSDQKVKSRLLSENWGSMSPKLTDFLKQAYSVLQPSNYHELLKLIGMAHGTQTWKHNAEALLMDGECKLPNIPATCEEVFMMIRDAIRKHSKIHNLGFAYEMANKVHQGSYAEHGMDGDVIETLKELGFDDWFVSYLSAVRYMSTQVLPVMELKYIILLTWYQTYHPKQYAKVIGNDKIW